MSTPEPMELRGVLNQGDYIMIPANVPVIAQNRVQLIQSFEKGQKCAEIGAAQGGFSLKILETEPSSFWVIDPWDTLISEMEDTNNAKRDRMICTAAIEKIDVVRIMVATSFSASQSFDDNFLDWIYIDADHKEHAVYQDLKLWYPKIKPGGLILGHDFCTTGTWRYGTVPAVFSFLRDTPEAKLKGMTAYKGEEFPSFVIEKP